MADTLLRSRTVILDAVTGVAIDHQSGGVLMIDTLSAGASVTVIWLDSAGQDAGVVTGVLPGRILHAG